MAFFQEPDRQPFLRVPAATIGLIGVLIVAHVARALAPPTRSAEIIINYGFVPARYSHAYLAAHGIGPQPLFDQAAPFVTYMFLHANFTHLAINCIWLLPFGAVTARRFGPLIFLAFFLICGAAGAAAYLPLNWGSTNPVVGASAAISGLMGAAFRMIVLPGELPGSRKWREGWPPLMPILSRRIVGWTAIWIAINVLAGLTGLGTGPTVAPVAWETHVAGYFAGLLLAGPFDALQRRLRPSARAGAGP